MIQVQSQPDMLVFSFGEVFPEPWTLYKSIQCLPAGSYIKFTKNRLEGPLSFCQVSDIFSNAMQSSIHGSRDDALDSIALTVKDSVRAHQIADVPVGSFLSSGLDSLMISALASTGAPLNTLTLSFDEYAGTQFDESPLAVELAERFATKHSTINVSKSDFEFQCEKLISDMDQPTIDGVNTWFVARAASQEGMKVALSGVGGDELFASYPSFRDVPRLLSLMKPFSLVPGLGSSLRFLLNPLLQSSSSPKYAGLVEYGFRPSGAYLLRRGLYMHWELAKVMDPQMAKEGWKDLNLFYELDKLIPLSNKNSSLDSEVKSRAMVSVLEMSGYMRNQLLRDTDWASMAHSLEIRTPFVDLKLLKDVIPWFVKFPDLSKPEITDRIVPRLPNHILMRPKTGFSIPVREWLLSGQEVPDRGLRGWSRYIYQKFTGYDNK